MVRRQTADLGGIARINDSGVRILHAAPSPAKGGGRQVTVLATSGHTYWAIALVIGLVAALVVAACSSRSWSTSGQDPALGARALLEIAGKVGANTANIPQLEATAPVLALIVDEAVVAGRLHERAHRRVRRDGE